MKRLWPVLALLPLLGCLSVSSTTQLSWAAYDEEQRAWPTSPSAMIHFVQDFPVYGLDQLPDKNYQVLGYIHVVHEAGPENDPDTTELAVVAKAREHDADAVLMTKQSLPAVSNGTQQTDYLVVKFKTDLTTVAIERINIMLSLTANDANGFTGPNGKGGTVHYTAEEWAAERAELEKERDTLLALPQPHSSSLSTNQ